jgi:uncharacterized protein (TIGR02996 family)
MLRIVVRERDGGEHALVFEKPEVTIGRVSGNDIVLPMGNISKRHARIVLKDGKMIVVDLKSTNGTYVNGKKLTSPIVVREDDRIYIGNFTLMLETDDADDADTLDADPTESRLLAAIAHNDAASRLVYADWLEERGEVRRAEFLRLQDAIVAMPPDDPQLLDATMRLRALAMDIDVPWRVKVARPIVEGCLGFEVQCPREWGAMQPTSRTDVRTCTGCQQHVHYCTSIEQARQHAVRRECIAIDAQVLRFPNDLRPPRVMMAGVPIAAPPNRGEPPGGAPLA